MTLTFGVAFQLWLFGFVTGIIAIIALAIGSDNNNNNDGNGDSP